MNNLKVTKLMMLVSSLSYVGSTALGAPPPDTLSTFAGGGPDHAPALAANVDYPVNTAVDSTGNFYFVGQYGGEQRVFKVSTAGLLTVLAGNGTAGFSGDGKSATLAELNQPRAIAVDASGNVFIADEYNCVIRTVTASTGLISTIAGTPNSCSYAGDGGPATSAHLNYPQGVAVDTSGNIYIADANNNRVRKVTTSGTITTVAGNGTAGFTGDGGLATAAEMNNPESVAVDSSKNIYIADVNNYRVRKVTATSGSISTVAGNGAYGYSGDGGQATAASLSYVRGITSDSTGRFFIADTNNCVVRSVTTAGVINTVAGDHTCGFAGDGGTATSAELYDPYGVAVDSSNHLYIADYYNLRIRKVTVGSSVTTVAGNGTLNYLGDGSPASGALLNTPESVSADASGNVYITDQNSCIVRKVNTGGTITTVAGTPASCGSTGDGSAATSARLYYPFKTIADTAGNLYIADEYNCKIRKVSSAGIISTFAGTGTCAFGGDGGVATAAQLSYPAGIAIDPSGNVYVADQYNHRIRKIAAGSNVISTVAGTGTAGFSGDGASAISAKLYYPSDVAFDAISGNLYIADRDNHRIRIVHNGAINTFAGNGTAGYQGDGVLATETSLYYPSQVAVDVAGDVIISDYSNQRIRWVGNNNVIQTVAGIGTYGFSGDGNLATTGQVANAWGVGVDKSGNIYIADTANQRVRLVSAIPNINASTYNLSFAETQVGTTNDPETLQLHSVGPAVINALSTSGDFIEADDCPSSIGSNALCHVDVYFTPSAAGTRTGTLSLSTNSFFGANVGVSLTGTGGGLTYTPQSANFGKVSIGVKSSGIAFIFTNYSSTSVTFSSVGTNRTTFGIAANTCTGSIGAGKSCSVSVTFTPAATGLATASLIVKDSDASSPQLIPLRGTGVATALSPTTLSFGTVTKGSASSLSTTLTNKGTTGISSLSAAIAGANAADFTYTTTCGSTLAGGANCSYKVTFKPSTTALEGATLSVTDNEGTFGVGLTGTGH